MLIENLVISTVVVSLTILVHFVGLAALMAVMRSVFARNFHLRSAFHGALTILIVVFGLALLHSVEIWLYAALYLLLGEIDSLEHAVYFSASTFSTVGYGDVILSPERRLIAAIEGAHGFLLIGWSTAFLVSVTGKIGLLEAHLGQGAAEESRSDRKPS